MSEKMLRDIPFPAGAVARFIVSQDEEKVPRLGVTKLHKLVYIAHGWTLGYLGQPLIQENVVAWDRGPAILDLHKEITAYSNFPLLPDREDLAKALASHGCIDEVSPGGNIVQHVCKVYGRMDTRELVRITHYAGSPWDIAYGSGWDIIYDEMIEEYYRKLFAKREKEG